MPQRALTQLFVDRIGPPKTGRVEYWDTHLTGLGLRVSATGAKSWVCMYRVRRGGGQVRETLGSVAEIPAVADARRRALASIEAARAGLNPVTERKVEAERARAVAREAVEARFSAVADRFLVDHVERNLRQRTAREWRRVIEKELVPVWGIRPMREVEKVDVLNLLNAKAATRPKQADEIRKVLRRMCTWALGENLIAADPTEHVAKRIKTRETRDRVLSEPEIRIFWAACDRLNWPFGPLFKLLLLTGQRREEVGAARWSEFDTEGRTWCIPATRAKNKNLHLVHLSTFALEILEGLPRTGDLLFASRGSAPSGYSAAKRRLDAYMAVTAPWVLHDLRRSAASGMAALGVAPHVVDRVLNHVSGTIRGVAAVYNRHRYEPERKAALEAWGRHIESLVRPTGDGNVVEMRQHATGR